MKHEFKKNELGKTYNEVHQSIARELKLAYEKLGKHSKDKK